MPAIRKHIHSHSLRGSASSQSSDTTGRFQPLHSRPIPKSDKGSATNLSRFSFNSNSREHLSLRDDIVQELKAEDAKAVAFYDPRTIARDILTAADKHPTNEGINNHLAILRKRFRGVNMRSDLSTFRWDIVDSCEGPSSSRADPQRTTTTTSKKESITGLASSLKKRPEPPPLEKPEVPQFTEQKNKSIGQDKNETGLEAAQKCEEFECKWLDCDQVFINLSELVSHVRQSHVMGSPTRKCSWTNCGKVQPMSTSGLWEHVLETHVKTSTLERNGRRMEFNNVSEVSVNCKWESCDESFSDVQELRAHALRRHVINGLSGPCDWFNCECFQPMSPLGLWEHVLSTHLPPLPPRVMRDNSTQRD